MSWQEELRKLDGELAAGHISADDYRLRRDQVLASAMSAEPMAEDGTRQNSGDADNTQIVTPESERTQALGWQSARPDDADRTQAVPGVPPQNLVGGMPPRPAPGYPREWPNEQESPPWAGSSLPPLAAHSAPDWVRQGPEVFDESQRSRKGLTTLIVVAVLAVVVGGGIWWATTRSEPAGSPPVAKETSTPQPSTTGPPRPLDGLNGEVDETVSGRITVAQAAEDHQFSPEEADILGDCEAGEGEVQVLYQATWYTVVHIFPCGDPSAREKTVDRLREQQRAYGFKTINAPRGLPGMIIENAKDVPDAPVGARVFYTSEDNVVRVEVRGHTRADVDDGLSEVLAVSTKHFPAS